MLPTKGNLSSGAGVLTFDARSPSSPDGYLWDKASDKALIFYFSKSIGLLGEIFRNQIEKRGAVFFLSVKWIPGSRESPIGSLLSWSSFAIAKVNTPVLTLSQLRDLPYLTGTGVRLV